MIQNDQWIAEQGDGMIDPFTPSIVRRRECFVTTPVGIEMGSAPVISYGLGSYGYDLRLSPLDFRVFRHVPGTVVDPKSFNPANLEQADLHEDHTGSYFILPGHSYGLGVALEYLSIPDDVTVICIGKSTYARCGLIANLTPGEAGWKGHLTLEFSNSSAADCKVYANEGVVQLLFLKGNPCSVSYDDRSGKYQGQNHEVTLARV